MLFLAFLPRKLASTFFMHYSDQLCDILSTIQVVVARDPGYPAAVWVRTEPKAPV